MRPAARAYISTRSEAAPRHMEEDPGRLKRRFTVPSSVLIPAKFESIPTAQPRKPTAAPNGRNHRLPPPSFPSPSADADFHLLSFNYSAIYTSLKDLLPSGASLPSPTPAGTAVSSGASVATTPTSSSGVSSLSGCQISIRNRLVKQAAWAYLQPMASSPSASGRHFSLAFFRQFLSSVKCAVVEGAARAWNFLAHVLWLVLCR